MKFSISERDLRRIVNEELKAINEDVDHEGVKRVVTNASKLLKALESFKEADLTPAMVNAVTPHVDTMIGVLEQMVQNPGSYVSVTKKEPKRVQLRRVEKLS